MTTHLELFETEQGHFTVIVGGVFADHLGRDEALGVVASVLFAGTKGVPYLKTYEQWSWWQERYRHRDTPPFRPAALLSWNGRSH